MAATLDKSVPTILWSRVQSPSTTSTLFQFIFELSWEKYENKNKKSPGLAH